MKVLVASHFRVRPRGLLVGALLAVTLVLTLLRARRGAASGALAVTAARRHFRPPLWHSWGERLGLLRANCVKYLGQVLLSAQGTLLAVLLAELAEYSVDPTIYKKSRWMLRAKQRLHRTLRAQGREVTEAHAADLEREWAAQLAHALRFENVFRDTVAHLRVFGRAMLDPHVQLEFTNDVCGALTRRLLPWYLGRLPTLDSAGHRVRQAPCLVRQFRAKMHGCGIVVPIFPGDGPDQVARVARLLQVLRVLRNKLPVQVTYFDEALLPPTAQAVLVAAALQPPLHLPRSLRAYLDVLNLPRLHSVHQKISFFNILPVLAPDAPRNHNLLHALAAIFNPFAEIVLLDPHTIPLLDVATLFGDANYRTHGTLFFKVRSAMDYKPVRFRAGFWEANELLQLSQVHEREARLFGLQVPKRTHTRRVTEKGFDRLLDPSMMVINKKTAMPGLLMSSVLPLHAVLQPRLDFRTQNAEHFWLGQELAATHADVNFNNNFAAAAGVVTPPENMPDHTRAREICSSSWGQLYDADSHTLVYVTLHQLENLQQPGFAAALRQRLTVARAGAAGEVAAIDDSLPLLTVERNPLYIQLVFLPVAIDDRVYVDDRSPATPWHALDEFAGVKDHWCAYDSVGSADLMLRSRVVDYGPVQATKYMFLLDVWQQEPPLEPGHQALPQSHEAEAAQPEPAHEEKHEEKHEETHPEAHPEAHPE